MRVLLVGQLPVEAGGSYTTGVCNVVYELSKCANEDVKYVVYATNMLDIDRRNEGNSIYRGTRINIFSSIIYLIKHPIESIREWNFYKHKCHASFIRNYAYRYNIERVIKEERPDIIHCMNVFQTASCYFANKKYKLPLILTLHGVNLNPQSQDFMGSELADVVTGLTKDTMKGIKSLGVNDKKMVMIPNGTDTSRFYYSDEERVKLRNELGVDDNTTVMLTIGSISHRKGQLSFIYKLKAIPNNFKYLYLIIGKGDDEEKIRTFVEDNKMYDRVRIIGYVDNSELYKYHSAADVYVHASRWEGQALSEVEAYATDIKIVLNRDVIGTVITDTTNPEDYWLFDFDTFDEISFMRWASQHKRERKTRRLYDWKRIFEMYSNVYFRLMVREKN